MKAFLGIDVSKGYADFTLLDEKKNQLEKPFQLDDSSNGHKVLIQELRSFIAQHHLHEVFCGVESTGGFENNWYLLLEKMKEQLPIHVARLNPLGIKHAVVAGLKRNITDALSSRYIAEYLVMYPETVDYLMQNQNYASFRSLHKYIFLLKKQKGQLINQLRMILYSSNPELSRFCKSGIPGWVLILLQKYPTATLLAKAKPNILMLIKNITNEKALLLINNAKESVASRTNEPQDFLIRCLSEQIEKVQISIDKCKKQLSSNCKGKEINLLCSISGIAEYSAASIMIEIENIKRFPSPKHLVSYFGVHPVLKESGDKKSVYRMSKKGRAMMRATLYMCAKSAVIHSAFFKNIYHKKRESGMKHKQAIGVIMQKMLRIIWGVLSSETPYNEAIMNNKKSDRKEVDTHHQKVNEMDSKRRFQPLDEKAPVSGLQYKKRKALIESQDQRNVEQIRDQRLMPIAKI